MQAYMPCDDKYKMVTVDLTTFQISVINTPDTRWQHPGMFTVDKDIYTLYGGYTTDNELFGHSPILSYTAYSSNTVSNEVMGNVHLLRNYVL